MFDDTYCLFVPGEHGNSLMNNRFYASACETGHCQLTSVNIAFILLSTTVSVSVHYSIMAGNKNERGLLLLTCFYLSNHLYNYSKPLYAEIQLVQNELKTKMHYIVFYNIQWHRYPTHSNFSFRFSWQMARVKTDQHLSISTKLRIFRGSFVRSLEI